MRPLFLAALSVILAFSTNCTAFVPSTSRATAGGTKRTTVPSQTISLPLVELYLKNKDDDNVRVDIIPDVDAFTLTAVGFGLIAFNFFVLANVSSTSGLVHIIDEHLHQYLTQFISSDGRCRYCRGSSQDN